MKKQAEVQRPNVKQQVKFLAISAGIWFLIGSINDASVSICLAAVWGACFTGCLALGLVKSPKGLKALYSFEIGVLVLCAIFRLWPKLASGLEGIRVAKSPHIGSAFITVILILGILGMISFSILKALPYITAMVAVFTYGAATDESAQGQIKEPEELSDEDEEILGLDEWIQTSPQKPSTTMNETEKEGESVSYDLGDMTEEEIISACKIDDWFRKQPPGTAYSRVLETRRNGTWCNSEATETVRPATERGTDLELKGLEKVDQTNQIETLEREIEERERQIVCGERYNAAGKAKIAVLVSDGIAWAYFLVSRLGDIDDATRLISGILLLIVAIFWCMTAATCYCLETVCCSIDAPTNPKDLKKLKKEQKKARKALEALQTR